MIGLGTFYYFIQGFDWIDSRIDLKQFLDFNNWNHLTILSFGWCGWFNNDDWRALVKHADNFISLKDLYLSKNFELFLDYNKISDVKNEDIGQFKSL